jgi:YHS domain-containing protein
MRFLMILGLTALAVGVACAQPAPPPAPGREYVPTADPQHPKARYTDSLVSMNDRCPVRQSTLSLAYVPVYVNGRPIGFCCHGCPPVFVGDPERYLKALGIAPPDLFHKGKLATVDSSLRHRIGFEIYYFSSRADMDRFKKDPLRYCGVLTDPVSMARFQPTEASPHATYAQRLYYFAADSTREAFLKDPSLHKDRRTGLN